NTTEHNREQNGNHRLAQELAHKKSFLCTQAFSQPDFHGAFGSLRRREVHEIDAGDQQNKDGDGCDYIKIGNAWYLVFSCGVEVDIRYRLKAQLLVHPKRFEVLPPVLLERSIHFFHYIRQGITGSEPDVGHCKVLAGPLVRYIRPSYVVGPSAAGNRCEEIRLQMRIPVIGKYTGDLEVTFGTALANADHFIQC